MIIDISYMSRSSPRENATGVPRLGAITVATGVALRGWASRCDPMAAIRTIVAFLTKITVN